MDSPTQYVFLWILPCLVAEIILCRPFWVNTMLFQWGGKDRFSPRQLRDTDQVYNVTPQFYSIKLLSKIKLITKTNNWTYINVITTLNDQNHISENCIGSVIYFFILTEVSFVYIERAGFMTCTASSHQGGIKEPTASLSRTSETPPVCMCTYLTIYFGHTFKP